MNLNQQRIVITGAASGIGACLLRELATYNVQILCVDVNAGALKQTVNAISPLAAQVYQFVGNLALRETVDALFEKAQLEMGGIDVFVANAGFAYYEKLDTSNWQHIEKIFQVNVFSPIYSAQKMRDSHPATPYIVVMIASAMAYISVPGYALYASTKATIDRFAEGYRFDMPTNGHLMVVYPVATRTGFFQSAGKNVPVLPPSQTPEFVAKAILNGLMQGRDKVYPSYVFRFGRLSAISLHAMRVLTHRIGKWQFQNWLK